MLYNDDDQLSGQEARNAQNTEGKAGGYRVEDESGVDEKDLTRNAIFGQGEMKDQDAPGMESRGMGGHKFNEDNNTTPTGNDKDNPQRNAGTTNAYLSRTGPSEEYPEYNNFKAEGQQGAPAEDQDQSESEGSQASINEQVAESNTSEPDTADYKPEFDNKPDYGSQNPAGPEDHIET